MLKLSHYNRWQAFASHLLASLLIFFILLTVIVFIWYPGTLINAGGWQGIKIVAGIDLVLGPLLTLIVYNPNKKSLKFDLILILLVQACALTYGTINIHNQRPYVTLLSYDGVHIITYIDFNKLAIESEPSDHRARINAYLDLPSSQSQIETLEITSAFIDSSPLIYRSDLYREYPIVNSGLIYLHPKYRSNECISTTIHSLHYEGGGCINAQTGELKLF